MAWSAWYTSFSDAFKKRAGRYLINKYLGTFLDETVSLDQLSVDGAISLNNVALNIRTINSLIDSADLPVEFVDGFISDLSVTIPWANLLNESCFFSISGLTITIQVKKRANPAQISASIFHSMCESFSSFTLADECMKAEDVTASPGKSRSRNNEEDIVAGVELLAQAIDSVIMRVQVKLLNTTVRLEYMPGLDNRGIALELQIGKIIYSGETGDGAGQVGGEQFSTSTVRKVFLEDINLLTDEFSLSSHISPCTSLHTSRYNNRSPNSERRTSVNSDASGDTAVNDDTDNCDKKPDIDPPLMLASLAGKQELVMRFTEMNQFGLPRAVDEIEIGLGHLKFHIYPHQVHILTEIASAVTVPAKPAPKPPSKQQRNLMLGLEGLIQENLKHGVAGLGAGHQGLNVGWGERDLDTSREFMPAISRSQGFLTDERQGHDQETGSQSPPMPRIKIRSASCIGILHMMDPGIIKLGGEPTRGLAMMSMRLSAESFFSSGSVSTPVWDCRKLVTWHHHLGTNIGSSHLQLLAAPVNIVYEEGTSFGPGLSSNYAAMTTLILGKVSLVEFLVDNCDKTQPELINLLKFSHSESVVSKKSPDVKLVYKDTYEQGEVTPVSTLTLNINTCSLDIDPGIIDRTYLLLNYADLDPECVRTNSIKTSDQTQTNISVSINSPSVDIIFHVPKPDMRHPHEIGAEFIGSFWTRKVHPELFNIKMIDFSLKISQDGGSLAPLHINTSSTSLEINYQDSHATSPFQLIQARRMLEKLDKTKKSYAVEVDITVCMDDSLRLQGKFNSKHHKMKKSVMQRKESPDEREFFVVDPEAGFGQDQGQRPGFLQQQDDILAALKQAALKNNLLININIDAVSLVIPSKDLYEVIYNRLGNDLLLWLPQYMAVKHHIYGEKLLDPLHDDTHEFSGCFSGRPEAIEAGARQERPRNTTAFPKDRQVGALEIHVDTAVCLSCNQVQLLVCLPVDAGQENLGLLHVSALGLGLTVAAGLDKDPEISLLSLQVSEGCIKHGLVSKRHLPDQLHFNPGLPGLSVLVTTNSYCDRAWPHKMESDDLLRMTAKILLDTTNNLKSVQLALQLQQLGLCVSEPGMAQDWINAIADFFTVVEFPVLGYAPPAVLTEMHLRLVESAVELAPLQTPIRAALCLGKVGISCSLLDSTQDASLDVSLEDTGLYLSKDSNSPTSSSVCVADIDYLDLTINLSEPELNTVPEQGVTRVLEPTLLISAAVNLVRIRTCADTLQILTELLSNISPPSSSGVSESVDHDDDTSDHVVETSDVTLGHTNDDMLPDLEDAMEELENEDDQKNEKPVMKPSTETGAQVYYFPGERNNQQLPSQTSATTDLMSQSIYIPQQVSGVESDEDSSDLDSFCILEEEEGSGIVPSGGGPAVRCLVDGPIKLVDNHFNLPEATTDHLKAPRGFPKPQMKLSLTKMNLLWQIFGGNDFSSSKEMKHNCKAKLEKAGVDFSGEAGRMRRTMSVHTGVGSAIAAADNLKLRGGAGRNTDLLIEVVINKMAAQHEVYPHQDTGNAPVSRQILIIPSLEVRDKLGGSEINKLVHMYSSKTRPRQSSANMFHIKCLTIKPEPDNPLEETSLKVSLQPLRLNIDQDTLFFIIDFVNTLMPQDSEDQSKISSPSPSSSSTSSSDQTIKFSSGMQELRIEVPEGAEIFEDARSSPPKSPPTKNSPDPHSKSSTPAPASTSSSSPDNLYFKTFIFSPSVPIRIDYVGKYVDLTQGALTGVLAGLAQLNCSELTLNQLELKQGILGLDKLLVTAANAWLNDIRSSQLPALLGGVGPMHAFLQMIYGIRDLVLLPLEQYQKDGRIVRGLQKGTTSFTHSTTLSLLDVSNKLLNVVKFMAELAFDVMSPDGCVVAGKLPHPVGDQCKRKAGRAIVRRSRGTPADLREGMLGAVQLLREGFDETARSLVEAAAAGDRASLGGAVGGVLRAVPSTMVRPVILGAAATSNLLDGVKNQISPDQRVEEEEKWKTYS